MGLGRGCELEKKHSLGRRNVLREMEWEKNVHWGEGVLGEIIWTMNKEEVSLG